MGYSNIDLNFGLLHLCNQNELGYTLDKNKIRKAIALKTLESKEDGWLLSEYVQILNTAYEMGIPYPLLSQINNKSFDSKNNLYESYSDADLSFLQGHAIIIPKNHLREYEQLVTN